ncbi:MULTISPECIES: fimbrial protein [Pseudomonas]|jgi:major type 1 subunit fimbrin (pilin)|uniref:fimbrial protein n=1 Tax=Pseudomonas TaxID=286 RepID=UPI000D836408|nr:MULTISPECIES: fimbrial protein [Pseudomonas]MCP8632105.1 type 1 fimbrial protein [Pseudomonas sp. DVZ6]MDC0687038.1 fimbrial protein [Mitsuaria sp. RG]MDD7783065.1 fimbrial protein [Pseudomonas sp. DVZ24]PYC21691.1 type 1 fimbrial protein [Pseudomonas mosselii]
MNLLKSALAVGLCCVATSGMAADGEISFVGSVNASTCSVSVGDVNNTASSIVSLGNVSSQSLKKLNDTAGAAAFELHLQASGVEDEDCDLSDKTATVRFLGMSGVAGPNGEWLGLENAGSDGVARNVAVQIRDAAGNDVQMGRSSSEYANLSEPLRFTANYIATGAATPGTANAKASFSVDYK